MVQIVSLLIAYVIGAIPTGAWLSRLIDSKDITQHGSGNIGATNVARVLGIQWFLVVFTIDMFKAYLVMKYLPDDQMFAMSSVFTACALLLGNGYSVFLGGKGGKGIATSCGIIAAYSWYALGCFIAVWLCFLALLRNVGIASVVTCIIAVILSLFIFNFNGYLIVLIALWCIWRHQKNIYDYLYTS